MDFQVERKIEVNRWIIRTRWLYMMGILAIGLLTKVLSKSNVYFTMQEMVLIVIIFLFLNFSFYLILRKLEKQRISSPEKVNLTLLTFLSYLQIVSEIVAYTYVMHRAGGIESMSSVFFFLPIVSASLLFGLSGSITIALVSSVLLNLLVVAEYFDFIPHVQRYGVNSVEFTNLSFSLTKTITTSVFYFIVGLFSGFGANLLFRREKLLQQQSKSLEKESHLRNEELKQLDNATKLLTTREKELSEKNIQLDGKIKELENSKISLTNALNEIKEAKTRSEEEKNKTLAIVSNFTGPIIVLNKENRITLFNLAAKIALGLKNSDLGREAPIKDGYSLESFRDLIRKKFDFKKIKTDKESDLLTEEMYLNEDGNEAVYKVITVNVKDSWGNNTGVMKIFYDLTREKIIDKMKSDFISIAAHQLRTPLSAIKWSTDMLLNGDVGSLNIEQKSFLQKSYASNEVMIHLVNDLLNVSRIEEGRFGYIFKNITAQEILDTVIENAKQQIEKAGITLEINNQEKHVQVCIDKEKMVLAFQNLLENAIKYTPRYGKIEFGVAKTGDDKIAISIKDSGVGIPEKEKPKIFSKFFRASNVVLMETEGTGLGLFIVKNIVDKHGGKISIESEENKGTKVTIILPIECKV